LWSRPNGKIKWLDQHGEETARKANACDPKGHESRGEKTNHELKKKKV